MLKIAEPLRMKHIFLGSGYKHLDFAVEASKSPRQLRVIVIAGLDGPRPRPPADGLTQVGTAQVEASLVGAFFHRGKEDCFPVFLKERLMTWGTKREQECAASRDFDALVGD